MGHRKHGQAIMTSAQNEGFFRHLLTTPPSRVAVIVLALGTLAACANEDALTNVTERKRESAQPLNLTPLQLAAVNNVITFRKEKEIFDQAQERASRLMNKVLFDPATATFLDLRPGKAGGVCGKVNAKNRFGAYVGYRDFVVTKDDEVYIARSDEGLTGDPFSNFGTSYLAQCATSQERADLAEQMAPAPSVESVPETPQQEPDAVLDVPAHSGSKSSTT